MMVAEKEINGVIQRKLSTAYLSKTSAGYPVIVGSASAVTFNGDAADRCLFYQELNGPISNHQGNIWETNQGIEDDSVTQPAGTADYGMDIAFHSPILIQHKRKMVFKKLIGYVSPNILAHNIKKLKGQRADICGYQAGAGGKLMVLEVTLTDLKVGDHPTNYVIIQFKLRDGTPFKSVAGFQGAHIVIQDKGTV